MRATLATIADAGVEAPSAIVVGDVAALDLAWFEQRPLFGRTVVVTRAREQASELRARLEELGAEVIELPAIAIEPIDVRRCPTSTRTRGSCSRRRTASTRSSTAASRPPGSTPARSAGVRIAAIGPAPRDALGARGHRAPTSCPSASSPSRCSTRSRAGAPGAGAARPRRAGARRAARGPRRARATTVDVLAGVPHRAARRPTPTTLARVRAGDVDAITFTSSSTVDNFCDARRRRFPTRSRSSSRSARSRRETARDARPARRRRGRSAHHRRPRRRPLRRSRSGSGATGSLSAVTFPERRPAPAAAHARRCAGWSPSTGVAVDDLVAPLFVKEGIDAPEPVASMPGVVQHTQESLRKEVRALADLGVPAVMLFGVPAHEGRARFAAPTPPTASCRSRCATCATRSATRSC